ncbi:MAG TPA: hypothetical protein VFP61_00465 [Acidimicrobiales bacterium]|nr:hypothetical protein [Acidimicrobiales bacterium]
MALSSVAVPRANAAELGPNITTLLAADSVSPSTQALVDVEYLTAGESHVVALFRQDGIALTMSLSPAAATFRIINTAGAAPALDGVVAFSNGSVSSAAVAGSFLTAASPSDLGNDIGKILSTASTLYGLVACIGAEPCGLGAAVFGIAGGAGFILTGGYNEVYNVPVVGPTFVSLGNAGGDIATEIIIEIFNQAENVLLNGVGTALQYYNLVQGCDLYYGFGYPNGVSVGTNPYTCPVSIQI